METTTTIDLNASVSNGTIAAADKNVEIDLRSVYTGSATDVPLAIGKVSVQTGEIVDGILTFNSKNIPVTVYGNGTLSIKIASEGKLINAPVLVVTKTIGTLDELRVLKDYTDSETMQGGGYYKLTADIENIGNWATGFGADTTGNYMFGVKYGFKGVFDGDGHKLVSMAVCWNGVDAGFVKTLDGGTIKNVAFLDFIAGNDDGVVHGGNGYIENVYVRFNAKVGFTSWKGVVSEPPNAGWSSDAYGTFSSNDNSEITLTNVVIDLSYMADAVWTVAKTKNIVGRISDKAQFTNVAVIGMNKSFIGSKTDFTGKMLYSESSYTDGTTRANGKVYVAYSGEDGNNGVEFPANNWNTNFWTVDAAAGTITWKTK